MNEAKPRFCTACGAALSPGARFCAACGAAVVAAPAGAAAAPEPQPAAEPGGERRRVAVPFADLCGSTRLAEALDPEEMRALLERLFAALDDAVRRHGGAVDKHVGDATMAVFGAPVSHGNDGERAVAAAFAMHEATAALGRELGRDLAIHVGVAGGEVVAGTTGSEIHRAWTVTGEAANLAARLVERAGPSETVVNEPLRDAAARVGALEKLGEVALRGVAAPARLWRAARAAPTAAPTAALVGRDAELAQIAALVDAASRGEGRVALLRGDPGIGKTRLVEEALAAAASRGARTLRALVLDFGVARGGDAASAIARALADAAGGLDAAHGPALAELLGGARGPADEATWNAMTPATREAALRAALVALAAGAAAGAALVLAVEDLHWADPDTLGRLAALAAGARGRRLALLLTTRSDGDPVDRAWRAAAGATPFTAIDLAPLGEASARALAAALLAGAGAAAEACVARAEGNPLFLVELARNAAEAASALPDSVQSVVQARIDRLAPEDKALIQCAAVAGQRVDPALLAALAGRDAIDCARLVAAGLLRPEGDGFLFGHALIRDGVYATLLRSRRARLHGRAAAFYAGREPALAARHLDRADDPGAPAAYRVAAEDAAAAGRFEEAIALAARGLELAPSGPESAPLARARAGAELELGHTQAALDGFRLAAGAATEDAGRCAAWLGVAGALRVLGRLDDAFAALDEASRARGASSLPREAAREHWLRGNLLFARGRSADCAAEHERALGAARAAGDPELEARALGGLGDAAYAAGRMRTALARFEECVALCAAHGLRRIELANWFMTTHCRLYLNDSASGIDRLREFAAEAARIGNRMAATIHRETLCMMLGEAGRWEQALAEVETAIRTAREIGFRRGETLCHARRAIVLAALGRVVEAREAVEAGLPAARESSFAFIGPTLLGTRAALAPDDGAARAALAEGEAALEAGAFAHNHFSFRRDAMDVCRRAGRLDEALRHAAALEAFTAAEPLPWPDFNVRRTRALVAHARGERGPALRDELAALAAEARRAGLAASLPELEAAIAAG